MSTLKKEFLNYVLITVGSILYSIGTLLFIFPNSLLLGGTSGISVILDSFFPHLSSGNILVIINLSLLILAFFTLGKDMAIKVFVGSALTTLFIGILEPIFALDGPIVQNNYLSAVIGASIIAVASGVMFYVKSSSGGTDIIALIVKKYTKLDIGKALLLTDVLIVIVGGALSGFNILISSFIGLLIKTLGIDVVIFFINKAKSKKSQ